MTAMKHLALYFGILLLFLAEGSAAPTDTMVALYKKGVYEQVCHDGMDLYYQGNKEPHFAAMVGMACAKTDVINPLGVLQRNLVTTPALRSSATYFSTLILAKRLLYQHFIDGISLDGFVLPKYKHVLSVVYDHINRRDFKQMGTGMIRIEHGKRSIFVSVSDDDPARLLVDEYEGAKLLRRHWYQ